jgi:hypothetical protein
VYSIQSDPGRQNGSAVENTSVEDDSDEVEEEEEAEEVIDLAMLNLHDEGLREVLKEQIDALERFVARLKGLTTFH